MHLAMLQDQLLGALVGMVRATENNEEKITDETNQLLAEVLSARLTAQWSDVERLTDLLSRVRAEKQRLVPDCFVCQKPCGRNDDYDMGQIASAPETIRTLKVNILDGCSRHATLGQQDRLLYRAVYALGLDEWSVSFLESIAQELV